ncbi:MAG TPA: redoxin family protein [Candidatus Acidoferrales bacterium]|nr:redoxin family protein [Candidatus Acidoferrales bacterium]
MGLFFRTIVVVLIVLCVAGVPAGSRAQTLALTGPTVGRTAPAFSLTTLTGTHVTLSAYAGKTLVINVWATWCPPCREETPDLVASYRKLHGAAVAFLGVDSTEEAPIVRAFVAAKGVPYAEAIDVDKGFERAYDIQYFPTTLVIDAHGILRARYMDVMTPALLARLVASAARGQSGDFTSPYQQKIDALLRLPVRLHAGAAATLAAARRVRAAIKTAEKMIDDSDPAAGKTIDLLRTRVEEAAIRDRAVAALAALPAGDRRSALLLAQLQGDAATDRERWPTALAAYRRALAVAPNDLDALSGFAWAAGRLNRFGDAIGADARLVTLQPNDVEALVDLGLVEAKAGRYAQAYTTFDRATALGARQVRAHPRDPDALRLLVWAHLYAGRTYAQGGERTRAAAQFEEVARLAARLPRTTDRHDMYLEEAQEALVALELAHARSQPGLTLGAWTGVELPGSVPDTIKYRLILTGRAGDHVALQTHGVQRPWIASFCTDRLCAPFRVSVVVPESGVKVIEFQLIPNGAPMRALHVRIDAADAAGKIAGVTT